MRWSDIPFHPAPVTLRQFAMLGALILAGSAAWQWFMDERLTLSLTLLGLAFVAGFIGLVMPAALRPVFVGWMVLAFPVGWMLSHLMLAGIFYCLFTPLALIFRLAGRDVLGRRFRTEAETYWTEKPSAEGVRSYFRQS